MPAWIACLPVPRVLGFRIAVISEPPPAPGARELFPDILADVPTAFLCFLFFVLRAD